MATARHPFTKYWKGPMAVLVLMIFAFLAFLWTRSYLAGATVLLVAGFGLGAYLLGDSSKLPGTAGKGDRNIRP